MLEKPRKNMSRNEKTSEHTKRRLIIRKPLQPVHRLVVKRLTLQRPRQAAPLCCQQLPSLHHVPTIPGLMSSTQPRRASVQSTPIKVAVLHQALPPPTLNGVSKPAKPGGYKDSGSDIAYALTRSQDSLIQVLTPTSDPDPASQDDWTFPETPEGIHSALEQGATHLWANVHSFSEHPLQTRKSLDKFADTVKVVGQPPKLADYADDKAWFNDYLRNRASELNLELPKAVLVNAAEDVNEQVDHAVSELGLPVIAKPPRGRGSSGVKRCDTQEALRTHVSKLLDDGGRVIVEEFLSGEEGTVTVFPPARDDPERRYKALPIVQRFDQMEGIMAYSGKTPVSANSRARTVQDIGADEAYSDAMKQCEAVARVLEATACVRVDLRRRGNGRFALFDVNLKPNYTGPGRPARNDQLNLMSIGAEQIGWDYMRFLKECLARARPLGELRKMGGQFDGVLKLRHN